MFSRIRARGATLGVAGATGASLILQAVFFAHRAPLRGDEGHYVLNALCIARGEFEQVRAFWSPLYSALGAIPVLLGMDPEAACGLVNLLATVALVPVTAWLAAVAFGSAAAVFAAWMIATCPLVAGFGARMFSEPTAALLGAMALALALPSRAARPGRRIVVRYFAAGALAVLATLGRNEMFPMMGIVVACGLWGAGPRPRRAAGASLAGVVVTAALLGAVLHSEGWMVRYLSKPGSLAIVGARLSESPEDLDLANYGLTPDGERMAEQPGASLSFTPAMGKHVVRRALREWPVVFYHLLQGCASPFPLLLAAIGLLVVPWRKGYRVVPLTLGLCAALPLVTSTLVHHQPRYLMPGMPFLMVLAAGGVANGLLCRRSEEIAEATEVQAGSRATRVLLIWIGLLILVPLPWTVSRPLKQMAAIPRVYREVGHWMRDNLPSGRMLARPGTYVSYYAGVPEYTFFPASDAATTIKYARRNQVRYLVVDGRLCCEIRPGVGELLVGDDEFACALGLRQVYANDAVGPDRVVIYELSDEEPGRSGRLLPGVPQ